VPYLEGFLTDRHVPKLLARVLELPEDVAVSAALLDCPCAHGRSVKLASGVRPTKTFLTDTARRWKGHVRPWKNKPDWRAVQLGIPAPETARKLPPPAAALLPAHNSAGATTVRCVNRGEEQPTRARQTSHVVVHGPLVSAAGGGGAIVQERAGYAGAAGAKQMARRRRPAWTSGSRTDGAAAVHLSVVFWVRRTCNVYYCTR
jgi:hypothetical protein